MDRKIILYRSRFQPTVSEPHVEAFHYLEQLLIEDGIEIAKCLFGFCLVKHDFEKKEDTIKELVLQGFSKNEWENYLSRFSQELNMSPIGQIKTDIAFSEIGLDRRTATFIIPNLIRTAIALYKQYPIVNNKQIIGDNDRNIQKSLPLFNTNEYEISWYFPIYDLDDINDMGYLSAIYFKNEANENIETTLQKIDSKTLFTRYNYHKKVDTQKKVRYHKFRNLYFGRYISVSKSAKKTVEKAIHLYYYSTIPKIDEIPFIYKWSSIYKIANNFISFFNKISQYDDTDNKNTRDKLLNNYIECMTNIIEGLKDNNSFFSNDLKDFFTELNDIRKTLDKTKSIHKKYIDHFKSLYLKITEKDKITCGDDRLKFNSCQEYRCDAKLIDKCPDHIENHIVEKKRVEEILKLFKEKIV